MRSFVVMACTGAFLLGFFLVRAAVVPAAKTSAHTCPPTSKASTLPKRAGKSLRADVDGDGLRDRITMRTVPHSQCPFFLLAQTAGRNYAVPIARVYRSLDEGREPYPALAVQVSPRRSQIVVTMEQGPSTAFVSFYGLIRGRLRVARFGREVGGIGLGGTVTHYTWMRCVRAKHLTLLGMGFLGHGRRARYEVARERYRLTDRGFRVVQRVSLTVSRRRWKRLRKAWGFDTPAFKGCLVGGSSRRLR